MNQQSKGPEQETPTLTGPGAPFGVSVDPGGVTVFIEFNPERHAIKVDFSRSKIRTWDMVIGYLHMAVLQAETQRELTIASNMAKQQREKDEQTLIQMQLMQGQEGRRILQH